MDIFDWSIHLRRYVKYETQKGFLRRQSSTSRCIYNFSQHSERLLCFDIFFNIFSPAFPFRNACRYCIAISLVVPSRSSCLYSMHGTAQLHHVPSAQRSADLGAAKWAFLQRRLCWQLVDIRLENWKLYFRIQRSSFYVQLRQLGHWRPCMPDEEWNIALCQVHGSHEGHVRRLQPPVRCLRPKLNRQVISSASTDFVLLDAETVYGSDFFRTPVLYDLPSVAADTSMLFHTKNGSAIPVVKSLIVQVNAIAPWLGAIGLGQGRRDLLELSPVLDETTESVLDALVTAWSIPGRSWAYTAGAWYREFHHPAPLSVLIATRHRIGWE